MKQSRIIQLSTQVANQIAAGEVVERPFSVVKELLENAIDANATKIDIDIEGAGLHLIRIRDNGEGIYKEDLALAFSPHATSKISTQADLEAITSMGFRGEALASIASISRCRLMSKPLGQDKAWQIQPSQDETLITPVAHPNGTTIEVADLFYNTPVRRKFLRSEKTEFQAIEEIVKRIALAFSHVSITLNHQQKLIRHYPAVRENEISSRLAKICGQQFVQNAAYFSMEAGSMALQGWLGFPNLARRVSDCQYFFVNQRMIKDRLINHVIKTLYSEHPQMIMGTYPSFVLYLTIDPCDVDVNVHPTKQEVRFANALMVHDFLSKCVRDTLQAINNESFEFSPIPLIPLDTSSRKNSAVSHSTYPNSVMRSPSARGALNAFYEAASPSLMQDENRVQVGKRYAFLEDAQGIVIVDLEKAKPALTTFYFEQASIPSKPLLFPLSVKLKQPLDEDLLNNLKRSGFVVRTDKEEMKVLHQPQILQSPIDAYTMESLVAGGNVATVLSKLNLSFADNIDFLSQWVNSEPMQGVIRLSHEEIETFQDVAVPTI